MYGVESSKTESSGRYFQILKSFFCYSLLHLKEVLSVTKLKSDGFFQAKIISIVPTKLILRTRFEKIAIKSVKIKLITVSNKI